MSDAEKNRDAAVRVVGRRRQPRALEEIGEDTKENARAWSRAMVTPFVPRGIYRFNTHEEADQWLWKMITRPRKT